MCTVTFVPGKGEYLLGSSRDEHAHRERALKPQLYAIPGSRSMVYPLDLRGGGTWVSLIEGGDALILLNGAFHKHQPENKYKKSRGLILLELAVTADPITAFNEISLDGIEPFTLIACIAGSLHEVRWDGCRKYQKVLDNNRPYLWSSVTLYDTAARARREECFDRWVIEHPRAEAVNLLQFHANSMSSDPENGFVIRRENGIRTQSISLLRIKNEWSEFTYVDLLNESTHAGRYFHKSST